MKRLHRSGPSIACRWLMMIAAAVATWGCDNKEIMSGSREMCRIDVRFLWDNAQGAAPEGMTLLLYPQTAGSSFWRYEIAGREGGLIEVEQGAYMLIAVNNDLPGIELRNEPEKSVEAVTRPSASDPGYADATGMLYEGLIASLAVTPEGVSYRGADGCAVRNREGIVECSPDSVSTVLTVILTGAEGMERVRALEAIFDGCSRGIALASGTPLADTVATAFGMNTDAAAGTARGSTTLFLCDKEEAPAMLRLRARYADGRILEKKTDISQAIKNHPHKRNVEIIIKGMNFPEMPQGGDADTDSLGINVGIDGWNVIEINY